MEPATRLKIKNHFWSRRHTWLLGGMLTAYVVLQCWCIQQLSINYDEGLFAEYGVNILKLNGNKDIVKFDSKLPITAINMLPRAVEQIIDPALKRVNADADIIAGRYMSLIASIMLSLVIYRWSSLLYGRRAGLCSFIVFLLCPNFLAHGIFVSSDIFACLFMTSALFFLWKFNTTNNIIDFFLTSLLVGFAEISKFSMVHLFIIYPLLFFCAVGLDWINREKYFKIKRLLYLLLIFTATNWLMICAAHLFYDMFVPLSKYRFQSAAFQTLQSSTSSIGDYIFMPFPSSYIKSMDAVMYFDHLGGGIKGSLNGPTYLLGNSSRNGFWYYYFVVFLYKVPLAVLALILISLVLYFRQGAVKNFTKNELYLLLPALYFLIYLNFFYSTQLGIRHILIIFPLFYIFIGFFFTHINALSFKLVGYGLICYQLISTGMYFPHFLPYTNELITSKKLAYKKIADTNICYGEGKKYLLQYLHTHPQVHYLPARITSGIIIMEVNEMLNLNIATMKKYDWTRDLIPVGHIHSQFLIFDVSRNVADSIKKTHLDK